MNNILLKLTKYPPTLSKLNTTDHNILQQSLKNKLIFATKVSHLKENLCSLPPQNNNSIVEFLFLVYFLATVIQWTSYVK